MTQAEEDFARLDRPVQHEAVRQLSKLEGHPSAGKPCGNKAGCDLSGCRSLHFARNCFRIVYEVNKDERLVRVWGIGRRERMAVYRMCAARLRRFYDDRE